MLDLRKRRVRLIGIYNNYSACRVPVSRHEMLVQTTGVLNIIWNSWNLFWRDYWLAHVQGGLDFKKNRIQPIFPNYIANQSCHYLLYLLGKKRRHNLGDQISGSFSEATWGAPKVIEDLAYRLSPQHPSMSYLSSLLSNYRSEIEHFQKIRNAFAHLNSSNISGLNNISSHYIFPNNIGLIDILDAVEISSQKPCFSYLCDSMQGFILNI